MTETEHETEQPGQAVRQPVATNHDATPPGLARRPVRSMTNNQARRAEQRREDQAPSFWESWGIARDLDSPAKAMADMWTREDPEADPDYRAGRDDWAAATEGIPPEMQDRLHDAKSRAELFQQAGRLRTELEAEQRLASAGWSGMTARIGANLFDESVLASLVVTEGAATPWIMASKATRIARAVRAGVVGAGDAAAMESVVASQRETHDLRDVLITAAAGGALGAGFGAAVKPAGRAAARSAEDDVFASASNSVRAEAEAEQVAALQDDAFGAPEVRAQYRQAASDLEDLQTSKARVDDELGQAEARLREVEQIDPLDELTRAAQRAGDDGGDAGRVGRASDSADVRASAGRSADSAAGDLPATFRALMGADSAADGVESKTAAVYRALMPERSQPVGAKEARKLKDGFDQRIREAQESQARRLNDAETEYARLSDESLELASAIDAKQGEIDRIRAGQVEPEPGEDVEPAPGMTRDDSAGADAAQGVAVERAPLPDGEYPRQWYETPRARYAKARASLSGMLKGQDRSATLRGLADRMFADGVGPAKASGETATISAAETQDRVFQMHASASMREYLPARKAWAHDMGYGFMTRNSEDAARAFGEAVTRYVRTGQAESSHVAQAGEAVRRGHRAMLEQLQAAGVEGFEDVAENARYMTRQWKPARFVALNRDPDVGPEAIRSVLTQAIRQGSDGIDDDVAEAMADAIFDRFLRQGFGIDTDFNRMLFGRDVPLLEQTLREANVEDSTVRRVVDALERREGGEQSGVNPRAKSRIDMDEDAAVTLPNGGKLRVADLMENDAEHLHTRYLRSMSGQAAIAKTLRKDGVEGPINVERYIGRALDHARSEGASQTDINRFRMGFNMILGRPPEDGTNAGWSQVARFVQGWNFVRLMGQVGFAQVAEMGPVVGQLGWTTVAARLPRLRAMVKRMKTGEVEDELMHEIEETLGAFGVERMLHQPRLHLDDWQLEVEGFGPWSQGAMRRADGAISRLQRGVADYSGISGMTIMMQRLAATSIAQKFLSYALKPSRVNMARMRSIGLDDDMLDRVLSQVKRHHTGEDGVLVGRKLNRLNLDRWDDLEARDALAEAMHKWANNMVQRNFVGELPGWMHTEVGKLLGQFRTFVAAAWEKQTLRNVNQADAQAAMTFFASSLFAGLSYSVQQYLNSLGRADAQQYRDERLSAVEIGKASFQRAGYASLLPGMIDTALTAPGAVDEPLFAYGRTTGLATSFLTGNPSVDLVDSAGQVARSTAATWRGDYDYSQEDFRALWGLAAFQNAMMFRQVGNMLSEGLPRESVQTPRTVDDYLGG